MVGKPPLQLIRYKVAVIKYSSFPVIRQLGNRRSIKHRGAMQSRTAPRFRVNHIVCKSGEADIAPPLPFDIASDLWSGDEKNLS